MRFQSPIGTPAALQTLPEPRQLLRWVYTGRLSLASAIFIAGVVNWAKQQTDASRLTIVTVAFALTTVVTVASFAYSEIYRKPLGKTFLYVQSIVDLLLVTVVVHVTPGGADSGSVSQFSALYVLVIAMATLMLPLGGGLLIAALGIVLFFADTVFGVNAEMHSGIVWAQLGVFAAVSLGLAILASQLQKAGEGKQVLVAALEHARLQADDILRNIQSGVVTVDWAGRLLYANPKAQGLLGVDLESSMGEPVLEKLRVVAPELAQALHDSVERRIRTTRGEGVVTTGSGAGTFPIGVTTTYTEGDGQRTNRTATAIFQDISDQKRIETLRLRAERLEGVAELSASLAHEIKNPLASIRSSVEQIAKMRHETPDQATLSGLVLRESDRLSRLLSEFLDFARVRVAHRGSVSVAQVVRGAVHLVEAHPERADVRIVCTVPDGDPLVVQGDEDLLHRAVFNLVLNAAQASPEGGTVRVDAYPMTQEQLPLGVRYDDGSVAVRVSDEGPGIPPEIRNRLFDPFFTTKPGGSGLGLAVVHRAIEAHRGLVFLDSSPRGSAFTVILPRSQTSNGDAS
ncbi:MAG: PAS domain S-box protein [Gemmatimonadota bacterium]|nr:PAS domain S-box protein [Gemmatimonadota bacterium]MDE3215358.1 PAS domain S-box protein [Gemmatimonadota bacterium]